MASQWRSLHAFFSQPQHGDSLILAVDRMLRSSGADFEDWFFIRYAEGGPHVRVRLGAGTHAVFEEVRRRLSDECRSLAEADPDPRWWQASAIADERGHIFAPGEVVEIAYVPETRRYGGEQAIILNEGLFRASTSVALAAIRATPDDKAKRARIAVGLAIAAASTQCESYEDLGVFFEEYAESWSAIRSAFGPALQQGVFGESERLHARYQAHREAIMRNSRPVTLVETWRDALLQARSGFEEVHSRGQLISPLTGRKAASREEFMSALTSMTCSQIHMLNNRLGFSPSEEAAWSEGLARMIAAS